MQSSPHDLFQVAWISGGCALLGALVGTFVSGFFTLRAKQNEYLNDFFKIVIGKRVEAYENLESLIQSYKSTVVEVDNQPYHRPFSSEGQHMESLLLTRPGKLRQNQLETSAYVVRFVPDWRARLQLM